MADDGYSGQRYRLGDVVEIITSETHPHGLWAPPAKYLAGEVGVVVGPDNLEFVAYYPGMGIDVVVPGEPRKFVRLTDLRLLTPRSPSPLYDAEVLRVAEDGRFRRGMLLRQS